MPASNNNFSTPSDPKTFVKTLNMLYLAILAGIIIFTGVAYFMVEKSSDYTHDYQNFADMLVPFVAISLAVAGQLLYKMLIVRIKAQAPLENKLTSFRNVSIIRYALWDGGGLFCVIGYMLIGNISYFAFLGIILVLFIFSPPTKNRIISDLNLSLEEEKQLG